MSSSKNIMNAIQELIDRKFNVVCFDWRGQGMSDRMIEMLKNNTLKIYQFIPKTYHIL